MSWGILFLAGIFEIFWAIGLKYSDGFTKLIPTIFTVVTMMLSFYLLSLALKSLPIGTAYAIWAAFGTASIVILGWLIFKEVMTLQKIIAIGLIIIGSVMLKLQHT